MVKEIESESSAVPESVKTTLSKFLSLSSDPQVLSQMPSLQRAQSLFFLAKITSTLLTLKLRCSGLHPDDHPIKSELERLEAATRFIEHTLPELTSEQRQNMRTISRGEGPKLNRHEHAGQKRKYDSSGKQSVTTVAKEFLEKAAWELLGNNNGGIKGPLQVDMSDEEDEGKDELSVP